MQLESKTKYHGKKVKSGKWIEFKSNYVANKEEKARNGEFHC